MQVHIVAPRFTVVPSMQEAIRRKIVSAFAGLRRHAVSIVVRLQDLHQSDGKPDQLCEVEVHMREGPGILIRAVEQDMQYAVDRAVRRAAYRFMRLFACRHRAEGSGERSI